jgi:hypothetical protein
MAHIKTAGHVDLALTFAELELIRRALHLVRNFGDGDDDSPARDLLADLSVMPA